MIQKVEVTLCDNDNLHQEYSIGKYIVKGYLIPFEIYEDILKIQGEHVFAFSDILDAFIDAMFDGNGQAISVDYSQFLFIEKV